MTEHKSDDQRVTFDALVRELLGLDPSTLAEMDPGKRSAAAGLHVFMRRTLERALGSLWAPDTTVFRLRSDAAARAVDWPNAALCNLSTILVWALSRGPRHIRSRSDLPLLPAEALVVDLPQKYVPKAGVSTGNLVAMARELLRTEGKVLRRQENRGRQAVSIGAILKDMLGVTPEVRLRLVHDTPSEACNAPVRDPDGQVAAALAAWMMSILDTSEAIIAREIQTVGFVIVNTMGCEEPTAARHANLTALLTAALLVQERDVAFFAQDAA